MNTSPVVSDVRSPSLNSHRRPRSRHEIVSIYSQKPLPAVPKKSNLRGQATHGRSCSDSIAQLSTSPKSPAIPASSSSPSLRFPQPPRWSLYPRQTSTLHVQKRSSSTPMKTVPNASSLPSSLQIGHRRSSQKVHQLFGHDLDVMEDARQRQSPDELQPSSSFSFLDDYYATSSTGSDSDGPLRRSEDALLPLIEEDDETASSRESSWVPSTPTAMPEPLNIWRKVSSESEDSVRSDVSSVRSSVRNFSLHTSSPKRWDPAYGQFTDRKASGAYHQFATELASSVPRQHTEKLQMIMGLETSREGMSWLDEPTVDSPPQKNSDKKSWMAGRLRLSGAAALARLWETNTTSPEAKTRPAAPARRNTLKKPVRVPAKTQEKAPEKAPAAKTLRVVPSIDSAVWPMVEQSGIKESPSKMATSQEPRRKKKHARVKTLEEPLSNMTLQESPMEKTRGRNPFLPASPTKMNLVTTASPEPVQKARAVTAPLTIDTSVAESAPPAKKSPVLKKPPPRQHFRSVSMPVAPRPPRSPPVTCAPKEELKPEGMPCSAFDSDTDDDEDDRGAPRWFSRRIVEENEPEWPRVQWTRRTSSAEREPTLLAKTGGQMKGMITSARDRALMSPAERRRSELRKSIKVLASPI